MKLFNIKHIPYYIIAALVVYILMIGTKEEVQVVIPSKSNSKEIKNPKAVNEVDTVYIDTSDKTKGFTIVEVESKPNEALKQAFLKARKENDSLKQVLLFLDAIKERTYIEKLEDSLQVVTVQSEVIGTLKSQLISYKTKPQTLTVKTERTKPVVYLGGFARTPIESFEFADPSFGINILIANKKNAFNIGVDNRKEVQLGYARKLF